MSAITPTMGAAFAGFLFLGLEVKRQWPKGGLRGLGKNGLRHLSALAPFLLRWCTGCLTVMVIGGVVGAIGDIALWGLNTFGDGVLIFGVGADSQGVGPGSASQPLTQGGLMVAALVIIIFNPLKSGASGWLGWLSGVGLGLTQGVALYASLPLTNGVNVAGAWATAVMV